MVMILLFAPKVRSGAEVRQVNRIELAALLQAGSSTG
jgi:hypothetical protein